MDDLEDIDAIVRRTDPDRWLASRFVADPAARADLLALYAYSQELARVAFAVEGGADKSPAPSAHTMVVGDGDTLWDISSKAVAGTDASIREMEQTIKELNSLESSMLVSGQTLIIPTAP